MLNKKKLSTYKKTKIVNQTHRVTISFWFQFERKDSQKV